MTNPEEIYEDNLPAWAVPGAVFRVTGGERWHVRGHVDGLAICRRWMFRKQRWHYEALDSTWFEVWGPRIVRVARQ